MGYLPHKTRKMILFKSGAIAVLVWLATPVLVHIFMPVALGVLVVINRYIEGGYSTFGSAQSEFSLDIFNISKDSVSGVYSISDFYAYLFPLIFTSLILWNIIFNLCYSVGEEVKLGADEIHVKNAFQGMLWGVIFALFLFVFIGCWGSLTPRSGLLVPACITLMVSASLLWKRSKAGLDMSKDQIQLVKLLLVAAVSAVLVLSRF